MKRIVILAVLLAALAIGARAAVAANADVGTIVPDHITLTWTGDPATTQAITWRTDATIDSGVVQFQAGADLTGGAQTKANLRDFETDLGSTHLFTAELAGLAPATKYTYRVGDGKHWSDPHTFTTADPKATEFKFLVFGDSQSGTSKTLYEPWAATVQAAYKANPDAKFMMNLGDLVETGQSAAHWNAWFDAAQGVIDAIPEMPAQGNHETMSHESHNAALPKIEAGHPAFYIDQFPVPQNGPDGLKSQVYSFDYGPVHFVVLDSQQDEELKDIYTPQQAWLAKDLAAAKATWKIALFHKPPYALKILRSNEDVKKAFCPLFDKYHVDLVLNGHEHGVARTFTMRGGVAVQKPSQGTIYYVVGRSGRKSYGDLMKRSYDAYFFNPQDEPNYLVVEVSGDKLTVKTVKQDGTVVDTFTLDKGKDIDSDSTLTPPATVTKN